MRGTVVVAFFIMGGMLLECNGVENNVIYSLFGYILGAIHAICILND
jgi:uncharacterized membrane protein YqaE (UPF0057 family)